MPAPSKHHRDVQASATDLRVLAQIARYRVVTAEQARWLVPEYRGTSIQNVRDRLRRLTEGGFLRAEYVHRRFSPMLFLLRHSALERIGRKDDKYITQLPRGVLSYLLFRNDVHACAFAESWSVASPATSPVEDHPALLAGFCEWAVEAQRRVVESRRAAVATSFGKDPEEYRLESINGWLPRQLTFEFLYRNAGARMTEIMLLIVVDPRRAVRRRRAETKRRPAELDLPFLPPGTPIVLRDHLSSFDCLKRQPFKMDRRMTTWRRVLAEKYGDKVDIADQLFPDLWAHRINTPSPA